VTKDLQRATRHLVRRVSHWTPPRWAASSVSSPERSRSDVVYDLVQRLAQLASDAEGQPSRAVPRLPDHVLPDQVRVLVADLVAADPPEALLRTAAELVTAATREL
jgi:hypothetical protein